MNGWIGWVLELTWLYGARGRFENLIGFGNGARHATGGEPGEIRHSLPEQLAVRIVAPFGERIDFMARFFVQHPEVGRLALHHLLAENPFPRAAWDLFVGQLEKLAKSDRAQDGIHSEMLGHILMAVGIMWGMQASAFYDDEAALAKATDALGRELKRLMLYGVLKPEAWPELTRVVEDEVQ